LLADALNNQYRSADASQSVEHRGNCIALTKTIDVKNIDFQIKKTFKKHVFFTFIKKH